MNCLLLTLTENGKIRNIFTEKKSFKYLKPIIEFYAEFIQCQSVDTNSSKVLTIKNTILSINDKNYNDPSVFTILKDQNLKNIVAITISKKSWDEVRKDIISLIKSGQIVKIKDLLYKNDKTITRGDLLRQINTIKKDCIKDNVPIKYINNGLYIKI